MRLLMMVVCLLMMVMVPVIMMMVMLYDDECLQPRRAWCKCIRKMAMERVMHDVWHIVSMTSHAHKRARTHGQEENSNMHHAMRASGLWECIIAAGALCLASS